MFAIHALFEFAGVVFQIAVVVVVLGVVGFYTRQLLNRIADKQAEAKNRAAAMALSARRNRALSKALGV